MNAWEGWKCLKFSTHEILMKDTVARRHTALFVLGIAIFGYLMYVLIRPEKF